MKLDAFASLVAVVTAAILLLAFLLAPGQMDMTALVSGSLQLTLLSIWTLAAIPLAFAIPRMRAAFFGRMWQAPPDAYLLPRWIVRLGIGAVVGQIAAVLLLAVVRDYRLLWLAGLLVLVGAAFIAGAWPRLKNPPA